jgi:hypothetical protein
MSVIIDLGNYEDLTHEDGRCGTADFDARIFDLGVVHAECEEQGIAMDEEEAEELQILLAFRAEVDKISGDFEVAQIVPDGQFKRFIRREVEDELGIGPDNIGDRVDWAGVAEDRRGDFTRVELTGSVLWVR